MTEIVGISALAGCNDDSNETSRNTTDGDTTDDGTTTDESTGNGALALVFDDGFEVTTLSGGLEAI